VSEGALLPLRAAVGAGDVSEHLTDNLRGRGLKAALLGACDIAIIRRRIVAIARTPASVAA
jgi:hypothetical protein